MTPPQKLTEQNKGIINMTEVKDLFVQANGLVFNSNELQIQYKSMYQGNTGQIAMQLESKKGTMSNVSIMIGNANGMLFNIAPVKYSDYPQLMLQVIGVDPSQSLPLATLFFNIEGSVAQQKIEFALPVFAHKFIIPIDMPIDNYEKFYEEYTKGNNPSYYRLDYYLKNPAPPQVPLGDVMRRLGGLLNGLNIKANPYPDMNNIQSLKGTGQFSFKNESGNIINLPIIVEIECYEDYGKNLRLSMRGGGSDGVIKNIFQVISLFLEG